VSLALLRPWPLTQAEALAISSVAVYDDGRPPKAIRRVRFTILGEPASKANRRRLVRIKGKPAFIKSEKALAYELAAALQIPQSACVMFTEPVRVTMRIYYATERPDLDESVVLDVLQARFSTSKDGARRFCVRAGVYVNDRQVREKHIYHAIDRKNPRAEIEVEEIA
jgi:Holliday junction resolvase RusA-like endonuclease